MRTAFVLLAMVCLSGCASLERVTGDAGRSAVAGDAPMSFDAAPVETMLAHMPTAFPVARRGFRRPSERPSSEFAIFVTAYDRPRWRQTPRRRRRLRVVTRAG